MTPPFVQNLVWRVADALIALRPSTHKQHRARLAHVEYHQQQLRAAINLLVEITDDHRALIDEFVNVKPLEPNVEKGSE